MSTFSSILQPAFDWTWRTSLQASVLTILVLLLQRLLRRWITPRLRYALSFLILCRLLLPLAPASSFSIENLLTVVPRPSRFVSSPTFVPPSTPGRVVSVRSHSLDLGSALRVTWCCGLLCLGGLAVWRYRHWTRTIRNARRISDARLLQILDDVRRDLGIRRPVTLTALHHLSSPAIFGVWRLHLVLPETSLRLLSDQEWRLIFLHEMTHIRNYDTILNSILIAVQFLHWFNPLIWVALQRVRADRELVCDALVVERLKAGDRMGYAQVLLRLAEAISSGPRAFPASVPVVSRASEVRTRVTMIKNHRDSTRITRAAVGMFIVVLGFLTFTRAQVSDIQIKKDGSNRLSGAIQRSEDENLILDDFRMSGHKLPDSVLDHLLQEANHEFGGRLAFVRALEARGITIEQFREELGERFIVERLLAQSQRTNSVTGMTNGVSAHRFNFYPDGIVAEGDPAVLNRNIEGLALNVGTNQGPPQKVEAVEIRFVGPMSIKEPEVRRRIRAQVGKPFSAGDVDTDVRNLYGSGLFYNVRASAELFAKGLELVYTVQCNPQIAKLTFSGNSKFSTAQLRKLTTSKVGNPFNERMAFADAQAIREAYAKAGLEGTEVKYSFAVDQPTGKASVFFEIVEKN